WQLYLAYALMSLGWTGMGTVVIATVLNAWFDRRRGLALSLAFNGATCGGIVLAPLLLVMTGLGGFARAMQAAPTVMVVVRVRVIVSRIDRPKSGMRALLASATAAGQDTLPVPSRKALLRDLGFWTMVLPIAIAILAQVGFIVHQVPFLEPVVGRSAAGL